jgi:hypothetical protein
MKSILITATSIFAIAMLVNGAFSQTAREFINKEANYSIVLDEQWEPSAYTDAFGRQRTEFVARNREEGLLTITRRSSDDGSLRVLVRNELNDMRLCSECLESSQEEFIGGLLSGVRVSLFYTQNGRKVVATFYYLQDSPYVWILRFTATAGSRSMPREVTDRMARSFCSVSLF